MWNSVSVIIPVYNSEKSLMELYNRLTIYLEKNCEKYEIIFVDDCSSDSSFSILENICLQNSNITAIKLNYNFGQQNAILCGFNYCNYNYVVNIDDDLQHDPENINELLVEISQGYDIVYGIADIKQHEFYRNVGSKLTNLLFNYVIKKPKNIRISSFRVLRKSLVDKIINHSYSFVYISASVMKYTKNISNIYFPHKPRKHGKSNYNFKKLFKIFIKIYIYYSSNFIVKLFRKKSEAYNIQKIINNKS